MTIILDTTAEAASAVAAGLPTPATPVAHPAGVLEVLAHEPGHAAVVLGAGVELDTALGLCAHLRVVYPTVNVLLVRQAVDTTTLMAAMRAGVREVVEGADPGAVLDACLRHSAPAPMPASSRPGPVAPRGQVVTVFAAKGGCGKTTIATNLAVVLANAGQRVCLVDLDLQSGDVAITLGLPPTRTLAALGSIDTPLDAPTVSSLLTPFSPNLTCALAPAQPGEAERITPTATAGLLDVLSGMFDYVVVDTAPQLSEHVLAALDASHLHVLLTTPEVPSLKNLRVTLDMLDMLSYDKSRRVVVLNRADDTVGLEACDVEAAIQSPVICKVPSSRDVPASINSGRPVAHATPGHPVALAVRGLADAHLLHQGDPGAPAPMPPMSGQQDGGKRPRRKKRSDAGPAGTPMPGLEPPGFVPAVPPGNPMAPMQPVNSVPAVGVPPVLALPMGPVDPAPAGPFAAPFAGPLAGSTVTPGPMADLSAAGPVATLDAPSVPVVDVERPSRRSRWIGRHRR